MDSFDISSDSEEGLLDEIVVGSGYCDQRLQQMQRIQNYHQQQHHSYPQHYHHHSSSNQSSRASTSASSYRQQESHFSHNKQHYDAMISPIHYCENTTHSDDNSYCTQETQQHLTPSPSPSPPPPAPAPAIRCNSGASNNLNAPTLAVSSAMSLSRLFGSGTSMGSATTTAAATTKTFIVQEGTNESTDDTTLQPGQSELEADDSTSNNDSSASSEPSLQPSDPSTSNNADDSLQASTSAAAAAAATGATASVIATAAATTTSAAGASFNHQLTADMCNYKNSKSRRLEYSLKCLKYGRSNPSQDSAFGSLTDNDFSAASSSFRISSFQSISSPIDEGVEDVIIATTTGGKETCLELATIPRNMVSQDSAISSPCRETSPNNFLNIDDGMSGSCSGGSTSSGSTGNIRPQQFPISLSPKILVTATTNSSNSSLSSSSATLPQTQQFDPPKILVNDQNSIYTTSPSKRSGTIEVFSQKYRVSSFEDMSPNRRSSSDKHLKNVNRMAFRSLEEERRIDSAFMPITDRTNSENRVNMQSEKYKKLTHASFRISKTSSQVVIVDNSPGQLINTSPSPSSVGAAAGPIGSIGSLSGVEMQRPATAAGSISSRQTMWRDSKFYRKNRIAKSNDSLLETSPNHSARLSPSSMRDNQYDSSSSYGSRSHSRQSLNRGSSTNEISGLHQSFAAPGLAVTTSFCGNMGAVGRRYCTSKSEDLGDSSDYLRVMDARKSYSERHLVTLTKLKQTAINNTMSSSEQCCFSEDELSLYDDNNTYGYAYQHEQQPQKHHHQQQSHQQQQHNHHRQQQQQQSHQTKHHRQQRHHNQRHFEQQQHQQQNEQYTQYQHHAQRPHPNQLSWSSCSINRLKTTNIKTTSLATLSCHQNLSYSATAHSPASTASLNMTAACNIRGGSADTLQQQQQLQHKQHQVSRRTAFHSMEQFVNLTENSSSGGCSGTGSGSGASATATAEENSSPDDSPAHQTLSGAELSKIFAMHDTQGSNCSEEKTPLLDSVEMSPISPTEPEEELADGEQM